MSSIEKRSIVTRQRKSTLTQQQKNKKRQRATPQQLSVLRNEFIINSTPNAKTREEIGQKIDMTERSVQIWFQNKRAKAKQFARRHHNGGYPNSTQFGDSHGFYSHTPLMSPMPSPHMHATAAVAQAQKSFLTAASFNSSMPNPMDVGDYMGQSALSAVPDEIMLPCTSLSIGSWQRVSSKVAATSDLNIVYSIIESSITYTMFADFTAFRIKYFMNDVKSMNYSPLPGTPNSGEIHIHLQKPPSFSIQTPKTLGTWVSCDDFSEMKQASYIMLHKLTGGAFQLQMQLAQIAQLNPLKVSSMGNNKASSNQMVSHYLEVPIGFVGDYNRISELGNLAQDTSNLLSKSEAPSPIGMNSQSDLTDSSVLPEKVRASSVPALVVNDGNMIQETIDNTDNLLYNIEPSIFNSDIEDTTATELAFTTSLFSTNDDWSLSSTITTPGLDVPVPASPGYLINSLENSKSNSLFLDDEFIDFTDSVHQCSSASNTSSTSENTSESLDYGFNSLEHSTDKLLITTSANLGDIEGLYCYDEASIEPPNEGSNPEPNGSSNGNDNALSQSIESFNGDSSLLALIQA